MVSVFSNTISEKLILSSSGDKVNIQQFNGSFNSIVLLPIIFLLFIGIPFISGLTLSAVLPSVPPPKVSVYDPLGKIFYFCPDTFLHLNHGFFNRADRMAVSANSSNRQ